MSLREKVTMAALLGAGHPLTVGEEAGALAAALGAVAARRPERLTLEAMAMVSAYEAAGSLAAAGTGAGPGTVARPDPRPRCGEAAAGHLAEILAHWPELLGEWLGLLAEAGARPPEERVPELLDAAGKTAGLRAAASAAAGPLGEWLAGFSGAWPWLAPEAAGAEWETAEPGARLALLGRLRAQDPGAARERVAAAIGGEPAEVRRQWVGVLETGLSMADEPLLESLLDDRSAGVRSAAAGLLRRLPGSRLAGRMRARLRGRVELRWKGLLRRTPELTVTPIGELTAEMVRDGVEKKPPAGLMMGEQAWWTTQVLAAVPPAEWEREFDVKEPERLVAGAANGQWQELLMEGWRRAAVRFGDARWLEALIGETRFTEARMKLLQALPPERREAVVGRWLDDVNGENVWLAMERSPHDWSAAFTEKMVAALLRQIPKTEGARFDPGVASGLRLAARRASVAARLGEHPALAQYSEMVRFRRAMREALGVAV